MIIEQLVNILAASVVLLFALSELNTLSCEWERLDHWQILEVIGLVVIAGGAIGTIGEWFLEPAELSSETILLVGCALYAASHRTRWAALVERILRESPQLELDLEPARVQGLPTEAAEFLDRRFRSGE